MELEDHVPAISSPKSDPEGPPHISTCQTEHLLRPSDEPLHNVQPKASLLRVTRSLSASAVAREPVLSVPIVGRDQSANEFMLRRASVNTSGVLPTHVTRSFSPKGESFGTAHGLSRPHPYRTSSPSPPTGTTFRQWLASQRVQKFLDGEPFWLTMYFLFNLGLTLFNKVVLVRFPFPYALTALHALFGTIGCYIAHEQGLFTPARLSTKESMTLASFSVLYAVNIAVSNLSLHLVTVPFHQVVRAMSPLFTLVLAKILMHRSFTLTKALTLIPVVAGVGFTTYGDYYFTFWGLVLTLFGTFLAALKTVVTNMLQSGSGGRLKLHPLDLLMRMSPLAFIQCVLYGWASGELERVRTFGAKEMDKSKMAALIMNGCIAFGLNVVSFTANKKAGPLTMTVAANVKQVLTLVLAVLIFDLVITTFNMLGIALTIVGGILYGAVEYREKKSRSQIVNMTTMDKPRLNH